MHIRKDAHLPKHRQKLRLGLVVFAYGIPNLAFAMLGGIIADRSDRLRLLISTRLVVSVLVLALAILKITDLV